MDRPEKAPFAEAAPGGPTPARSVVAVEGHPDDVELGCLGTLLAYRHQRDAAVAVAAVTLGDRGSAVDPTRDPEDVASCRHDEARAVTDRLGAEFLWLGEKDSFSDDSPASPAVEKLTRLLRERKADLVITPPPDDYHHDHLAACRIAWNACMFATVPTLYRDSPALERGPRMLYMDPITGLGAQPSIYVDITGYFDEKTELLKLHASQMASMARWASWDLVQHAEVVGRFRGLQCGTRYAEAFSPVLTYPKLRAEPYLP